MVDVLFNCMALQFVLELDNVLVKMTPRSLGHARTVLRKLSNADDSDSHVKFEHLVLFRASPPSDWCAFGWHRAHACVRWVMICMHNLTKLAGVVAIAMAYSALLFCHGLFNPETGEVDRWWSQGP